MIILYAAISLLATLYLYIPAINIWRNWDNLSTESKVLYAPLLLVFLPLDVAVNFTAFTVMFADIPREWTITERMIRYKKLGYGRRYKYAFKLCRHLNKFDGLGHC